MMMYDSAKVTLELRELIESGVKIWDFEYPTYYTGEEKTAFEKKVTDHFYFRQIGQETPGRWLHYFRSRMREIMPYYIDLYHSVELFKAIEDPLESYNLVETYTESEDGESTNTSTVKTTATGTTESGGFDNTSIEGTTTNSYERVDETTGDSTRKHSDTPQGSIANIENYMSDATKESTSNKVETGGTDAITNESTNDRETSNVSQMESSETTTNTLTATDDKSRSYSLTRRGNIGVQPLGDEIKKLREAYINIDMMIINELNDLFLMVY